MPEPSAADLYASLERRVNGLRRARAAGEQALRSASLRARELGLLYEATFLNLAITFEVFQENLFYSSLLGDAEIASVHAIISFRNRPQAERFVLATERSPFLSWTKTKEAIERAHRFLASGRPFSRLERRDRDAGVLKSVVVIRNAIAHQSGVAKQEFSRLPGARATRRPGDYLRLRVGPVTQHEVLCREVLRIAKALAAPSGAAGLALLLPERSYKSGEVSRGQFRCTGCGHMVRLVGRGAIPACPNCNPGPCTTCGNTRKSEFERT